MSLFSIFMPRIAGELKEMGFPIIKVEPSRNNPRYKVYKFEDTPDFQIALKKIMDKEHK